MSGDRIRYAEAAIIALDDAARTQDAFDVGQQLARAQAFATLASAEQARIGNLIAWKALRQSAPATALASGGDLITQEIEAALGITDPEQEPDTDPDPDPGADHRIVMLVPGTLAAYLAAEVFREHVADMGADDPVGRAKDIATLSAMADALEADA